MWTQSKIKMFIDQEIEENLTLEYKSAGSLGKNRDKKTEITKDVSAMANSAGGTIIYGVREYNRDTGKEHLPERFDPIDQTKWPKEWLEQIINNIRPRLDGVIIHPVQLNTSEKDVVYVIDIPQGKTAHQALDKKYYKRFNFLVEAMEDHEVRDVMRRNQDPEISLEFIIVKDNVINDYILEVSARNNGNIYARYVNAFVFIPENILHKAIVFKIDKDGIGSKSSTEINGEKYYEFFGDNNSSSGSLYTPILPGLSRKVLDTILVRDVFEQHFYDEIIMWKVYADNSNSDLNQIKLSDIQIKD